MLHNRMIFLISILEYYFMEPSGKIDKIIAKYNQDKEEFFIDLQDIFNSK